MSMWQPIETAPQDGTKVLLLVSDYSTSPAAIDGIQKNCAVGWFSSIPPMWVHGHSFGPTHWMPLPELPE